MESKICSICKEILLLDKFSKDKKGRFGRSSRCKECRGLLRREQYKSEKGSLKDKMNREKTKIYSREYRNRPEVKERQKKWREDNKERLKKYKKELYESTKYDKGLVKNNPKPVSNISSEERIKKYQKEYREKNKEKMREYNKNYKNNNKEKITKIAQNYKNIANDRAKERRKTDVSYKIKTSLRGSIRSSVKRYIGGSKVGSAVKDLGCSIEYLVSHLESKFYPNPETNEEMTWENHGSKGWHIDHIIPLSAFDLSDRNQFLKACHYTNLQPLWWFHNISKGGTNRNIVIKPLERKCSNEKLHKEFKIIKESEGGYSKSTHLNNITTHFNPHFYEVENNLWIKNSDIREKLINNRKKYLNKDTFTDSELLRGFKISGIHYGFSHHSSAWIKQFIKDFNIKSIYDPCGGWGHRLLGSSEINYIYNDIDPRSVRGASDMSNFLDIKNNIFYCKDASEFTPPDSYEAVFTCPPYFTTEIYNTPHTSTSKYKLYNQWLEGFWRNLIKKSVKPGVHTFAFIISNKYLDDMVKICEEEGLVRIFYTKVGNINNSHFQKDRIDGRENLVVFNISQDLVEKNNIKKV